MDIRAAVMIMSQLQAGQVRRDCFSNCFRIFLWMDEQWAFMLDIKDGTILQEKFFSFSSELCMQCLDTLWHLTKNVNCSKTPV